MSRLGHTGGRRVHDRSRTGQRRHRRIAVGRSIGVGDDRDGADGWRRGSVGGRKRVDPFDKPLICGCLWVGEYRQFVGAVRLQRNGQQFAGCRIFAVNPLQGRQQVALRYATGRRPVGRRTLQAVVAGGLRPMTAAGRAAINQNRLHPLHKNLNGGRRQSAERTIQIFARRGGRGVGLDGGLAMLGLLLGQFKTAAEHVHHRMVRVDLRRFRDLFGRSFHQPLVDAPLGQPQMVVEAVGRQGRVHPLIGLFQAIAAAIHFARPQPDCSFRNDDFPATLDPRDAAGEHLAVA